MSRRFEKIIAGAVVVGALTLTGCGGGGGGGGVPPASNTPAAFLGARAINAGEVKLFFSESVKIPDPTAAAGLFTLNRMARTYGVNISSTWFCSGIFSPGSCHYATSSGPILLSVTYNQSPGAAIGSVTSAAVSAGDARNVILKIPGPGIQAGDDGGTGALRLTYTGGANGIQDQDGTPLPAFSPDAGALGNTTHLAGGPAITQSRTISATQVEISLTEPVQVADGNATAAAANFNLAQNCFRVSGTILSGSLYTMSASVSGPISSFAAAAFSSGTATSPTLPITIANLSIPAARPNTIVLTTTQPIPAAADFQGFLRLQYTAAGTSQIQNTEAAPTSMASLAPGPGHRGNVADTVGANSTACTPGNLPFIP